MAARRLRLADDAALLAELQGQPGVRLSDHDADATLNVSSDSRLILSLHRLGFVSLEPALLAGGVSPDVDHSQ